jgi:putative SOS response-associated peptidase YedK
MCGRFATGDVTQAKMVETIDTILDGPITVEEDQPPPVNGWNIKPTQQINIIYRADEQLIASTGRWWFVPHWHKGDVKDWKATTFNAKIETAFEKPTFRNAWISGRCLIPAVGYYEWTGAKGKKQPWYIKPQTNVPLVFFAGLWARTQAGIKTCTILTRTANPMISELHPRMPVLLRHAQCDSWLSHQVDDGEVLEAFGTDWEYQTTSVKPFGIKDDGPQLIEPDGFDF